MQTQTQPTCQDRVAGAWASRRADLAALLDCDADRWFHLDTAERAELCQEHGVSVFAARRDDPPEEFSGSLWEYGLAFDYVGPLTFEDQEEGYWRFQISYGGPSEEIRFYASAPGDPLYKAEFWFLDWFDGASVSVKGDAVVAALWEQFYEVGAVESAYEEARR